MTAAHDRRTGPEEWFLGALQRRVLEALSKRGSSTVREITDELDDEYAYTTVMTVLGRLHEKRLVDRRQRGRGYLYEARYPLEELRRRMAEYLVDGLVEDARAPVGALRHARRGGERRVPVPAVRLVPHAQVLEHRVLDAVPCRVCRRLVDDAVRVARVRHDDDVGEPAHGYVRHAALHGKVETPAEELPARVAARAAEGRAFRDESVRHRPRVAVPLAQRDGPVGQRDGLVVVPREHLVRRQVSDGAPVLDTLLDAIENGQGRARDLERAIGVPELPGAPAGEAQHA
ncbi:MAG: BlaI/MecI/CopY family transcriptional regulator [Candidatus Limnocylindria bacterium]